METPGRQTSAEGAGVLHVGSDVGLEKGECIPVLGENWLHSEVENIKVIGNRFR